MPEHRMIRYSITNEVIKHIYKTMSREDVHRAATPILCWFVYTHYFITRDIQYIYMIDQTLNLRSKVMKGCCHRKPNQVWAPKHVPQRGNRLQLYSWVVWHRENNYSSIFNKCGTTWCIILYKFLPQKRPGEEKAGMFRSFRARHFIPQPFSSSAFHNTCL